MFMAKGWAGRVSEQWQMEKYPEAWFGTGARRRKKESRCWMWKGSPELLDEGALG